MPLVFSCLQKEGQCGEASWRCEGGREGRREGGREDKDGAGPCLTVCLTADVLLCFGHLSIVTEEEGMCAPLSIG